MKLPVIAAITAVFSFPALAASELPEGFDTFVDDLDFASTHCTRGMYRVDFDANVLRQVSQKIYKMRTEASGGMPPYLAPSAPTSTPSKERCFDLKTRLNAYSDTVLGIQGLVKP